MHVWTAQKTDANSFEPRYFVKRSERNWRERITSSARECWNTVSLSPPSTWAVCSRTRSTSPKIPNKLRPSGGLTVLGLEHSGPTNMSKAEAVPICMSTWVCGGAHLWIRASLDPEAAGIEILPIRMPEDWISIMPTLNGAASGLRWLEGQLVPPDESGPVQIGV